MRKSFVRIISVLAVLAMLFTTTACRKNPSNEDSYISVITEYIIEGEDESSTDENSSQGGNISSKPQNNSSVSNTSSNQSPVSSSQSSNIPENTLKPNPAKYSYSPKITSTMPTVSINTEDGDNSFATKYDQQDKLDALIDYVDATVSVSNCDTSEVMTDIDAEVKVRGNYTLNYEKKPLRIKFKKKQNMLGLGGGEKYKNWVLLADWKDISMTNNALSFYLGNMILGSDGYHCTDFRNVEVYLNGKYWGVYLLVEQQEVKEGRIDIPEVEEDYKGTDIGYLFEFDGYYYQENEMPDGEGDPTFTVDYHDVSHQKGFTIKSDIYDDAQVNFLKNKVQSIYNTVYDAVNLDEVSAKKTIGEVIDLQSLVDMYILSEICCDPDIGHSSFYMSLDMTANGSKKLVFQAPWDYDSAFGINKNYSSAYISNHCFNSKNPWFAVLKKESWFTDMVKAKWAELKVNGVTDGALNMVTRFKSTYEPYYNNNFLRWSKRISEGNHELNDTVNKCKTQADASNYLYQWLSTRFTYLDTKWN